MQKYSSLLLFDTAVGAEPHTPSAVVISDHDPSSHDDDLAYVEVYGRIPDRDFGSAIFLSVIEPRPRHLEDA